MTNNEQNEQHTMEEGGFSAVKKSRSDKKSLKRNIIFCITLCFAAIVCYFIIRTVSSGVTKATSIKTSTHGGGSGKNTGDKRSEDDTVVDSVEEIDHGDDNKEDSEAGSGNGSEKEIKVGSEEKTGGTSTHTFPLSGLFFNSKFKPFTASSTQALKDKTEDSNVLEELD